MYRNHYWRIGLAAVGIIALAACSRTTSTPSTTAESVMVTQSQPTISPAENTSPYPYPTLAYTESPGYSYPAPVSTVTKTNPPSPSPTLTTTPGTSSTPESSVGPYPVPDTPIPTLTATAKPTRAPNQTLLASDPNQVQLASGRIQLVEFFAFWDGASKSMAPMLNNLAAEYQGKMNFIFLDVDDPANKKFEDALNYRIQPQFFLLDKQGSIIKQWQGYVEKEELQAAIDGALQ